MSEPKLLFQSPSSDRPLAECIDRIQDEISWILEFNEVPYNAYYERALDALRESPTDASDILVDAFPAVSEDELRRGRVADAFIFMLAAQEAAQAGQNDSAWYRCTVAVRQLGMFEGMFRDPFSTEERLDFSAMGGRARGAKTEPVRAELARLIVEMKPEGGWKDVADLAKEVHERLFQFSQIDAGGYLSESNFRQTIRRWLRNPYYHDLQAALASALKKEEEGSSRK